MDFIKGRSRSSAPVTGSAVSESESRAPSIDTIDSSATKSSASRPKPIPRSKRISVGKDGMGSPTRSLSFDDTVSTLKKQTKVLDASIDTLKTLINGGVNGGGGPSNSPPPTAFSVPSPSSATGGDAFKAVAFDTKSASKDKSSALSKLKATSQQVGAMNAFTVMNVHGEDKLRAKRIKDLAEEEEDEKDEMDAVMTGDIIMLENTDVEFSGMLMGDAAFKRCGIQGHSWLFGKTTVKREKGSHRSDTHGSANGKAVPQGERPIALNLDDAAFRVIPKLKNSKREELDLFLAAKEEALSAKKAAHAEEKKRLVMEAKEKAALAKAKARAAKAVASGSNDEDPRSRMLSVESMMSIDAPGDDAHLDEESSSSEEEDEDKDEEEPSEVEAVLRKKVKLEEEQNNLFLEALLQGHHTQAIRYGTEINLLHVKSGLYVTVVHGAAPFDPDCRTISLAPCSANSGFKFMPRYKAQSNGSIVFYKHWLTIESVVLASNFIHTSPANYSPVPDPNDMSLPKCLRTGRTCETNLSSNYATFTIKKRCRSTPNEAAALQTGYPVRFYHSQSESFVTASANQEKGRIPGSFQLPAGRDGDLRMHVSYLKMLINEDGTPQPGDPTNHNSKQLWSFEPTKRTKSGAVCWASPVRIRHVMSGKYLAINTDLPPYSTASDGEVHYSTYLCDDAYPPGTTILDQDESYRQEMSSRDGDSNGALDLTFHSNMLFYIISTDRPASNLIPRGEIAVRIEHRYEDPSAHRGQRSRVLYLHNSEGPKPESLARLDLASKILESDTIVSSKNPKASKAMISLRTQSEEDKHLSIVETAQLHHKEPGTSFLLVFSNRRTVQDTFMMMPCPSEEVEVVNYVKAFYVPLMTYVYWVKNKRFYVGDAEDYSLTCQLFLDLMSFLVKGGKVGNKKSGKETDWISKANGLLPAEFSKLFDGEPSTLAQNMCRELKLLDIVFSASVAPYIRTYPLNPFAAPHEGEETPAGLVDTLKEMEPPKAIQKFTHTCLQRLTLGNSASQKYFGNRYGPSIAKEDKHKSGGLIPTPYLPWMDTLTWQLEEPLGAAVTLAALLSASEELMKDYATPHFVNKFADMVGRLGPQPRLIKFFHSLCVVGGKAIKANQELVLQQVWMDKANRSRIMLDVMMISKAEIPITVPFQPVIHPLSGVLTQSGYSEEEMLTFPDEYLGANDLVHGDGYDNSPKKKQLNNDPRMMNKNKKKSSLAATFLQSVAPLADSDDIPNGSMDSRGRLLSTSLDFGIPPNPYDYHPVYVSWTCSLGWRGGESLYYPPSGGFDDGDSAWAKNNSGGAATDAAPQEYVRPVRKKKASSSSMNEKRFRQSFGFSPDIAAENGVPPYGEYLGYPPIPSVKKEDQILVRIENLCWVLAPAMLCESVTGKTWSEVSADLKKDPYKNRCFERQCQLASYFEAQIQLMAQMCYGRSDNCCQWLARTFSYALVVSNCSNPILPPQIRAAFAYLARCLYLDRAPQSANCGRPSLPEQLWIYKVDPRFSMEDFPTLPLVRRNLKLEDSAAFPCFCMPPSHPLFGDRDPLIGFPTHTKFFLLRYLGNNYIKSLGDGCISHEAIRQNELTLAVMRDVVQVLLSFGFQSTFAKIKELLVGVVKVLDGRNDVERIHMSLKKSKRNSVETGKNRYKPIFRRHAFEPLEARYRASPASSVVAATKVTIINILMEVANLRANFRLAKLLDYFKSISEDHHKSLELKRLSCYEVANKMSKYSGSMTKAMYAEFEALFTKGDGARMDLDTLSGMPVNTILLDCLMYDDDDLFASALGLIERSFKQRSKLLEALSSVILLEDENLPIFDDANLMLASISNLCILVDVHESWGVSSNISRGFDEQKYKDLLLICENLQKFMLAPPSENMTMHLAEPVKKKTKQFTGHSPTKALSSEAIDELNLDEVEDEKDESGGGGYNRASFNLGNKKRGRPSAMGGFGQISLTRLASISGEEQAFLDSSLDLPDHSLIDQSLDQSFDDQEEHQNLGDKSFDNMSVMSKRSTIRTMSLDRVPIDQLGNQPVSSFLDYDAPVQYFRQDTLRAMNLQQSLFEGLEIDVNLTFRGSKSSVEEKIKSRRMLVDAQRALVDLLIQFVRSNRKNQNLVWNAALPSLIKLTGGLPMPDLGLSAMKRIGAKLSSEDKNLIAQLENKKLWVKGIGTERVIIECLRGNEPLVAHSVPKSLVERFGELLEEEKDLSNSPLLDFFSILCQPEGPDESNERNQNLALNVLLNPKRVKFRSSIQAVFFSHLDDPANPPPVPPRGPGNEVVPPISCKHPERIVHILCATIDHMNQNTATLLLTDAKLTMDAVLYAIFKRQKLLGTQFEYHTDKLLCNLVELLGSMMQVLMIDPRLFLKESCWNVVVGVGRTILSSFVTHLEELHDSHEREKKSRKSTLVIEKNSHEQKKTILEEKARGQLVVAIFKITIEVIKGARAGGLQAEENKYKDKLVSSKTTGAIMLSERTNTEDNAGSEFGDFDVVSNAGGGGGFSTSSRVSFPDSPASDTRSSRMASGQMRQRVTSTAALSPPISDSLEAIHARHKENNGMGPISGKTQNTIVSGCEDILKLILPTSQALRKAPGSGAEMSQEDVLKEAEDEKVDERGKDDHLAPVGLFDCFSRVLTANPIITNTLTMRRFKFAEVLENAEEVTAPAPVRGLNDRGSMNFNIFGANNNADSNNNVAAVATSVSSSDNSNPPPPPAATDSTPPDTSDKKERVTNSFNLGPGLNLMAAVSSPAAKRPTQRAVNAITVTFPDIIDRMMRYVKAHNYDKDESCIIRIFNVLMAHLLKSRGRDDGALYDIATDLDGEERRLKLAEFKSKQDNLNAHGVTTAVLTAIATHSPSISGNCADVASHLLAEILRYGNTGTQEEVVRFITEVDNEAKVLNFLKTRLNNALRACSERKGAGGVFEPMNSTARKDYEAATHVMGLMKLMVEGHYLPLQDLLRCQPKRDADINLIDLVNRLFTMQAETTRTLMRMEDLEVELLIMTMSLLVEAVQGPCSNNQLMLVSNTAFFNAIDKIIQCPFHARVARMTRLTAKSFAVSLLSSCLEGRVDSVIHEKLADEVLPISFDLFRSFVNNLYHTTLKASHMDPDEREARLELCTTTLVDLSTIYDKMQRAEKFSNALVVLSEKRLKKEGRDAMDTEVRKVEVNWNGSIEVLSFQVPHEARFLSSSTIQDFEARVDLRTAGKRMGQMLAETPNFIQEMKLISGLCAQSRLYAFLFVHVDTVKWALYALIVLLNLNLLMVTFGENGDPEKAERGYNDISSGLSNMGRDGVSVTVSIAIGIINLIGYSVLIWFLGQTEVPMLIHQTDNKAIADMNNPLIKPDMYRNRGAFGTWLLCVIGAGIFILMHWTNYNPKDENHTKLRQIEHYRLYGFIAVSLGLWCLSCVRDFIVVPDTANTRKYVLIYDLLVRKSFFRNNALLITCTIMGFQSNEYFSLMLLDIMNNSVMLGNILKCIFIPGTRLLMVMYLLIATSVLYAQFGLVYFEEDNWADCHSAMSCFWLTLYKAVPAKQMFGHTATTNRGVDGGPDFQLRMIFDVVWFIWNFLLFKVMTGLILSTFGKLRADGNYRMDILKNTGFVSGLERAKYGDLALYGAPSFDELMNGDQYHWNYVILVLHLTKKNPVDYTGCETFVKDCLDKGDLRWLPAKTSFAIQLSGAVYDSPPSLGTNAEKVTAQADGEMTSTLTKFTNDFNSLREDIKNIGSQMTKLEELEEDDSASRRGGSEYGGAGGSVKNDGARNNSSGWT